MKKNLCFWMILLIWSCSPGPDTPEGLLRMYIGDVTTKKVDKDYHLKYTTGSLRESVEETTEEELLSRSFVKNVDKVKVKILNKNCQEQTCVLTYIVSYTTLRGDEEQFSTETKKLAEIRKEDGDWKISNVTNLKTHHEALKPIDALNED